MSEIKFCKDCKWYKRKWFASPDERNLCIHPEVSFSYTYLATGKVVPGKCEFLRANVICGEEAKHFEPKEKEDE